VTPPGGGAGGSVGVVGKMPVRLHAKVRSRKGTANKMIFLPMIISFVQLSHLIITPALREGNVTFIWIFPSIGRTNSVKELISGLPIASKAVSILPGGLFNVGIASLRSQ
jgi:hypothetical protein